MSVFDKLQDLGSRVKRRLTYTLRQEHRERTASYWIIILQMGKVGSMNVFTSLKQQIGRTPIFHIHVLSEKQASRMQQLSECGVEVRRHRALVRHADRMRRKLCNPRGPRKKIISLVRDPVAQMIATTMSEYGDDHAALFEPGGHFGPENLAELQQFFAKRLENEYDFIAPWFDTEIRDLYGIDVLAVPFPVEQGYGVYQANNADLLLIRLEDLNHCYRDSIAKFLDIPDFELIGVNRAEDKGPVYLQAYKEFKNTVALPKELLDKLYSIPWARHLYSEKEIASFRSGWEKRQ